MKILQFVCLVVALFFTFVNAVRAYHKQSVPPVNFLYWALASAGFIWLTWLV